MASQANPTSWILLGSCALFALPLLLGVVSRTARWAALLSALCGLLGAVTIVGMSVYLRGLRSVPSGGVALMLFSGSSVVAATTAWLTYHMVDFVRQNPPLVATWKALRFLSLIAVKAVVLYVVLNGLWILVPSR